jgi:hypothetical protein
MFVGMSYRIQVRPEAGILLRTLAPHVVLRIGRALADLAEAIATGEDAEGNQLQIEDCVVQFMVDHAHRLLEVLHVERHEAVAYAPAENGAHP